MTKILKKICMFMVLVSCITFAIISYPLPVRADVYWPEGPSIESPYAVVMEVNTGTVLYEKNSHASKYPASITKIMTTLLAIEYCEMDEVVTFSMDAVYKNEGDTSHISRDIGEEMTMEECLYAVMLASANECSYAVAEHVGEKLGGDYQTFIDLMNQKAVELGCTDTHFNNCNGLPDPDHWTSAYDMALIAREAYQNAQFRTITGTGRYSIPPTNKHSDITYLRNHHRMLFAYDTEKYLYDYCTGGKTGYTDVAKNTLVTFAEKDGMTLVCVVMNATTPNHYTDTRTLLDYYFNNFHAINIAENDVTTINIGTEAMGVLNSNEPFVTLDKNAYIVLPTSVGFSDVNFEILMNAEGEGAVAGLRYLYGEREVGQVEIVASNVQVPDSLFAEKASQAVDPSTVIIIKPVHIILIIILFLSFVLMILLIIRLRENFYIIQHNREVKKLERQRFARIKKHRRRKKDRLFW